MNRGQAVLSSIVGSSFAGFTAAMELAKPLDGRHDIVVISDREPFIFRPSPIRVPFGRRRAADHHRHGGWVIAALDAAHALSQTVDPAVTT